MRVSPAFPRPGPPASPGLGGLARRLALVLVLGSAPDLPAARAETDPAPPPPTAHWSFTPARRPPLPPVRRRDWPRNPIDHFVLAQLERAGLDPSPAAARETLIRRLALDLTGLPPTPAELRDLLADTSPEAHERAVDGLMASRAYAERRAQEWLDLARYADTRGFADDRPHDVWPFRDWVIDAIHRNQPFDAFTVEQLAGDLLPGATTNQIVASAFHRNAPQAKGATYPVEEYRLKGVVDRINTTGTVWLGLTVACAECHDHKSDPISQAEYYRLFALFNSIEHTGTGFAQGGPHLALPDAAQAALRKEFLTRIHQQETDLAHATNPPEHPSLPRLRAELASTTKALSDLDARIPSVPVMRELAKPRDTFVHRRGNFLDPGPQVEPGVPSLFGVAQAAQPRNRLEFARWLVDGRHPLVARVVVNRFWQEYFGQGLVSTPDDFGHQGALPTHPELLDWLAMEFVANGWNMKAIHRLIVTSATYRQSAALTEAAAREDPRNQRLSRAPRLRLHAEQIRDQALAVAGLLQSSPGGPPVFPPQPSEYWEERDLPGKWAESPAPDRYRRTLYTFWRRMALHPTLELLDAPARAVCTPRRNRANLPTQALVLLNDPIFVEAARALARRILSESTAPDDDATRLQRAFRLCLARNPDTEEQSRFLDFLADHRARHVPASAANSARVPEPDLPAWSAVATVLLNLDEMIHRP